MKVTCFDKWVLSVYYKFLGVFSTFLTIFLLVITVDDEFKATFAFIILLVFIGVYFLVWIIANKRKRITLGITNSKVEIIVGDIFKETGLKVIGFNEYFDTAVNDVLISKTSLNGLFINEYYKGDIEQLNSSISNYNYTHGAKIEVNSNRANGKKDRYKLGTICVVEDYLITALSLFDENNKAYLEITDYINCLLNFWNEVDIVYNGRTVVLPILGSGITRFRGYENITDQELLEIIISTFKFSRVKFTYPSKVKIVIHQDKIDKINLTLLKGLES